MPRTFLRSLPPSSTGVVPPKMASTCTALRARCGVPARARRVCVTATATLKVYTNPRSRGRIIEWYLKELGQDAELVNMDMVEKKEHKSPEFLKVNPWGKLPALEDGALKVFESGAMLLYLADKYGPAKTPEQRARAAQWVLFANSTMGNSIFVEQFREKGMPDVLGTLNQVLSDQSFLEGEEFTVGDVAVGAYLLYIPLFFPTMDLSAYPHVLKYMERLAARPACAATVAAAAQKK